MRTAYLASGVLLAALVLSYPGASADARGGVNASYARAYCEYYRTKAMVVGRGQRQYGLDANSSASQGDRGSPEYWRRMYRECLKEHGY